MTINCKGKLTDFSKPKIAGILNITPDSFYDGGKYNKSGEIHRRIDEMISEGADFIDVGAYSSRPGAKHISKDEELKRLLPALNYLQKEYPEQIVSLDTFRAEIAKIAIEDYGVAMINDISAGNSDEKMFSLIAEKNVPYIIMHMQGTPQTMQKNTQYDDLLNDIIKFFAEKIFKANKIGINDIIVDPGFGFGKTLNQNYQILNELDKFKILDCPVMAGISRKSMIYKLLELSPEDVLPGTIALNMTALLKGANILRVHDVKETKQLIEVYYKLHLGDF
ncbi:MAG: dihydropteroate synthase [Bacteroidales bacterium]|nr:dihydropteroate synthase [Bacteroidales bacterium]